MIVGYLGTLGVQGILPYHAIPSKCSMVIGKVVNSFTVSTVLLSTVFVMDRNDQ